jgi:hypothetical protein
VERVARISSAVFVHANGLGSAFQVAIHSRTSFSSRDNAFVDAACEQLINEFGAPGEELRCAALVVVDGCRDGITRCPLG